MRRRVRAFGRLSGNISRSLTPDRRWSSSGGFGVAFGEVLLALDAELRHHLLHPARQPPGFLAEQHHHRRHQQAADQGRVDRDRHRQPDPELLHHRIGDEDEAGEDADHDRRRRGDHPAGVGDALDHRGAGVAGLLEVFLHLGQQEHLVIHREAEEDREHQQRHEADDRDRVVEPDQFGSPAELEDGGDDAVGGGDRDQVHRRGLDRHQQRAEGDQQDDEAEGDDDRDHQRQLVGDLRRQVDVAGGLAADIGLRLRPRQRGRDHFVAEVFDQVDGLVLPRLGFRDQRVDADGPRFVAVGFGDGGDVARFPGRFLQFRQHLLGFGRRGEFGGDKERPVDARSEARLQAFERLPRGRVFGQGADVVLAQLELEDRQREDGEDQQRGQGRAPGLVGDGVGPPQPAVRLLVIGVGLAEVDTEAVDPRPERPQHRRQQRRRGADGDDDRNRRGEAEGRDQRDAGEGERAEGDHHREAGEYDGPAGGRGGAGDRLPQLHPFAQLDFVAGDDEERVVDTDAEADHRRQGGGDPGHLQRVLEQFDDRERAGEADDRREDRQHHRRRRTEGKEEDDHRRDQADDLGELGLRFRELLADVAADRGSDACLLGRRRGVEDFFGLFFVDFARAVGEDDRDVGDPLVLRDGFRALVERAFGGVDVRQLLQPRHRFFDRSGVLRFAQLLAGGGFEDQRV